MGGMNEAIELLKEIRTLLESLNTRLAEKFPTWAECQEQGQQLGKLLMESQNRQVSDEGVS